MSPLNVVAPCGGTGQPPLKPSLHVDSKGPACCGSLAVKPMDTQTPYPSMYLLSPISSKLEDYLSLRVPIVLSHSRVTSHPEPSNPWIHQLHHLVLGKKIVVILGHFFKQ